MRQRQAAAVGQVQLAAAGEGSGVDVALAGQSQGVVAELDGAVGRGAVEVDDLFVVVQLQAAGSEQADVP